METISLEVLHGGIFFTLVIFAAITDATKHKIHNAPCAFALAAGLLIAYLRGGMGEIFPLDDAVPISLISSVGGAAVTFLIFFVAYLVGGMGAGDVKLITAVGALGGLQFALWTMLHAAIVGFVMAIILLIYKRRVLGGFRGALKCMISPRYSADKRKEAPLVMPYGVAIALGAFWTVFKFIVEDFAPLPFL